MITNTGKNLLAKYLVGQTPSYASHIAVGCGTTPVVPGHIFNTEEINSMKNKQSLNFEMFRVPIISRGFVNEDGLSKVVLTAEMPTEERYEITEVGIFSAGSNPVAGSFDSRVIYSFAETDGWLYSIDGESPSNIFSQYGPLDGDAANGVINVVDSNNQELKVFSTNADNRIFTNENRVERNERCRFLNNIVAMRGDTSTLSYNPQGSMVGLTGSDYIVLDPTSVDFTKNSPLDELRLAFSVVNRVPGTSLVPAAVPDNVKILLEFSHTGTDGNLQYAKFVVDIDDTNYAQGTSENEHNFANNRYVVVNRTFQELEKTLRFKWSDVTTAKIYASVRKENLLSDSFYVCLDALRIENTTSTNSLYGLTGYSVIKNINARPVIKSSNTTNYIEFRFVLDV
jgi:hypothetical protein